MTRERLPPERPSYTKVFRLKTTGPDGKPGPGLSLYFTVGLYDDGRPGEVFVRADKTGSMASGCLDAIGVLISLLLQHGVKLTDITDKLRGTNFPPASFTGDPDVPNCSSPLDLLARWLEFKFKKEEGNG